MPVLGVIGGSGVYDIPGLEIRETIKLSTPYGAPSDSCRIGKLAGTEVAFLPRHGSEHHIQPHKINYRANVWALRELGVRKVLSVGASGGISDGMLPGSIVVPDQIIDMTSGRESTFYDQEEVVHVDFTDPFCPDLRAKIFSAAEKAGVDILGSGTYLSVNGPRLETAAEIRAYKLLGADIVGMTGMPEAVLARELEICYAGISVITNYAAGISGARLTVTEVVESMKAATDKIKRILLVFFKMDFPSPACWCGQALKDARM